MALSRRVFCIGTIAVPLRHGESRRFWNCLANACSARPVFPIRKTACLGCTVRTTPDHSIDGNVSPPIGTRCFGEAVLLRPADAARGIDPFPVQGRAYIG